MNCVICGHPTQIRTKYCSRCKKFILNQYPVRKRVAAMQRAWSPENDCFLCYYTGEHLDDNDVLGPFYLCFDHVTPGDNSRLEVCSRHINELKGAMTEQEFRTNIPILAKHFETGEPIDPEDFRIDHFWYKHKSEPAATQNNAPQRWINTDSCIICGHPPLHGAGYCARCRRLSMTHYPIAAVVNALRDGYDKTVDGFRCHYTNILLDIETMSNRFYYSFDHEIPGNDETMVLCAIFINKMKEALSGNEFIAVVKELAHQFRTGEAYNQDIIKFEYWNRPKMAPV